MKNISGKIDKKLAHYRMIEKQIREEKKTLAMLENKSISLKKAQKIIQEVAQQVQEHVHSQVDSVVTRCLETVFGAEAYTFQILFEQKRGKTEARPVFYDKAGNEVDIREGTSGGAVDVASFALRIAVLALAVPLRRKVSWLDEPFKHLSPEYRPAAREMLLALAREMNFQFLMITHSKELACGKIIDIRDV